MDLSTRVEAGAYLNVSPSAVLHYIYTKRLPAIKKGKTWLILEKDLEEFKNSEWFQTRKPGNKGKTSKYSDDMPRLYLFRRS